MVFEDFQFDSLAMLSTHSAALNMVEASGPCHLVLDSGFSSTYAVPFFARRPMKQAALRLDIGGKMLSNLLGETISATKEFNLIGEYAILSDIKER